MYNIMYSLVLFVIGVMISVQISSDWQRSGYLFLVVYTPLMACTATATK